MLACLAFIEAAGLFVNAVALQLACGNRSFTTHVTRLPHPYVLQVDEALLFPGGPESLFCDGDEGILCGGAADELFGDDEAAGGDDDRASNATEEEMPEIIDDAMVEDDVFDPAGGEEGGVVAPLPVPDVALAPAPPDLSAAGSSGDVAPPEPAEAQPKRPATFVAFVPGGKLTYYENPRKKFVVAECANPKHGRCNRTRTMKSPPRGSVNEALGQGRPLGYLAAWLAKGAGPATKDGHLCESQRPSLQERKDARSALKAMGTPDAMGLLAREATKPDDAGSEPDVFEC